MPMNYDMEVRGLDELIRKTRPELYRRPLEKMFEELAEIGETVAKNKAPRFTGALQGSIHSEAKPMSARIFSNKAYAVPVEFGRRKGAKPPPVGPLRRWANAKNINVYALVKSIGRRGIKGRFFMKAAEQALMVKMPFQLKIVEKKIAKNWERGQSVSGLFK